MSELNEKLEVASRILLRCAVLGILFLLIWAAVYFGARDFFYAQGQWFNLTPHECDLIHYGGMGLVKIFILIFFLVPSIAIRMVVRKRSP